MATNESEDPVGEIVQHFHTIFFSEKEVENMKKMESLLHRTSSQEQCAEFTTQEVKDAIMDGKQGKAVGPDHVPTEMLKDMCQHDCSLVALTTFFNDILRSGNIPLDWDFSITTLLPKVIPPQHPKELRPIALASHISKVFSRLLMTRLAAPLSIKGRKQLAGKHRQPAEFLWSAVHMVNLCKEWKNDAYILKLDLRRAFDSVSRLKLAEKIIEWAHGKFPFEVRCLIWMLMSGDIVLVLPWSDHEMKANIGVKQGAAESPILFAKLLDDLLSEVGLEADSAILSEIPDDGACYMDDVLGWKSSILGLQRLLDALLLKLAEFGLHVQPAKCQLLCI